MKKRIVKEEWDKEQSREEWIETFGEDYVRRMEDPIGSFLHKAAKELGNVINFEQDYDGTSTNPLDYAEYIYCEEGKEKYALKQALYYLSQYDLISYDEEAKTIDVEHSNHPELAEELQGLLNMNTMMAENKDSIKMLVESITRGVLKEMFCERGEFDKYIEDAKGFQNNDNYSHFAVNKETNKIVNGWDYSDIDNEELRQFKKDYFIADLIDYELDPKKYTILTFNGCKKRGIDPNNNEDWANE